MKSSCNIRPPERERKTPSALADRRESGGVPLGLAKAEALIERGFSLMELGDDRRRLPARRQRAAV
jgi:hypothetical protein